MSANFQFYQIILNDSIKIEDDANLLGPEGAAAIGIQLPPGTQFSLGGNTITMGATGILEIDLRNAYGGKALIKEFKLKKWANNTTHYGLVDYFSPIGSIEE